MLSGRAWLFALVFGAGCTTAGDSPFVGVEPSDAAAAIDARLADAAAPDAAPCVPLVAPAIGAPCDSDADCGIGSVCFDEVGGENFPATGYCTRVCTDDDDCGDGANCAVDIGGGTLICLAACCGSAMCGQPDHVCQNLLSGVIALTDASCLPANPAAADGAPCSSFGDCSPESICADNPFNNPGGSCISFQCQPVTNDGCATVGTSVCGDIVSDPLPPFCLDACASGAECRTGEGYACLDAGPPFGMVCAVVNTVGLACAADAVCGMSPWVCVQGAGFPGGYCGAALGTCTPGVANDCPNASVCHSPGGLFAGDQFCARACDPLDVNSCRTAEGYACTEIAAGVNVCVGP